MVKNNSQGSTLIESLLILKLALLISIMSTVLFILSLGKAWSHFVLYEALICLAEGRTKYNCERKARDSIQYLFPVLVINEIELENSNRDKLKGNIRLSLSSQLVSYKKPQTIISYQIEIQNPNSIYRSTKK